MAELYFQARASASSGGKKLLKMEQRQFLAERDVCGFWPACIKHAYVDRISDLESWIF